MITDEQPLDTEQGPGGPGKPAAPAPPDVGAALSGLAHQAIAAGADSASTTNMLNGMLAHLKANPELAGQASRALRDGVATPAQIAQHVSDVMPKSGDLMERVARTLAPVSPMSAAIAHGISGVQEQGLGREAMEASKSLPGGEAAVAGGMAKIRGIPYQQAYNQIESSTATLPPLHKFIASRIGGAPLGLIPGPAGAVAGLTSAANELGNADPNLSLEDRLVRTGAAGIMGTVLGSYGGEVMKGLLPSLRSNFASDFHGTTQDAEAVRKAINDVNYPAALAAANGRTPTPAIHALVQNPDYEPTIQHILAAPQYRSASPTDPAVLSELIQHLTDEEGNYRAGLAPANPRFGNSKNFNIKGVQILKQQALDAFEAPGTVHTPATTTPAVYQTVPGQPQTSVLLRSRQASAPPPPVSLTPSLGPGSPGSVPTSPTLREGLDNFLKMSGSVTPQEPPPPVTAPRGPESVAQQGAREMLERRSAALQPAPPPPLPLTGPTSAQRTAQQGLANQTVPAHPQHLVFVSPAQPPSQQLVSPATTTPATTTQLPPYMPEYRAAMEANAVAKGEQRARDLGRTALLANAGGPLAAGTTGQTYSPAAIESWAMQRGRTAGQQSALTGEGVLPTLKEMPQWQRKAILLPYPTRATQSAGRLLSAAGDTPSDITDQLTHYLTNVGIPRGIHGTAGIWGPYASGMWQAIKNVPGYFAPSGPQNP